MKVPNKRQLQQIASNHSFDIDFKDFMKLYKDYTKEPYSFLVNGTTFSSDNPLRFRKNLGKRFRRKKSISEKINLASSGNVSKYEVFTGKDVLPEKDLLEKAAKIKRFECSPLGKEFKLQTDIANSIKN